MDIVKEVLVVHHPDQEADDTNGVRKFLTKVIELLLERGVLLFL